MTDLLLATAAPTMSPEPKDEASESNAPLRVLAVVDGTESRRPRHEMFARPAGPQRSPSRSCCSTCSRRRRSEDCAVMAASGAPTIDDRLINDLGKRVVTSAARHLDAAGIAHKDRIELGDPAETIVRCADEENAI